MFPNWLQQNSINREVLNERCLKIGFSQNGEDDFIRGFFWDEILKGQVGTYIDIGCYHETLYSNTKLLNLIGWNGIAVDANPELQSEWLKKRPKDHFINVCISTSSNQSNELTFYRFMDGALSTANLERAKYLINSGHQLIDKINIPNIRLDELAAQINNTIETIDFVSVDVEMIDYLSELPLFLKLIQPRLLCIECISDVTLKNIFKCRECQVLHQACYEIINYIGGNIFAAPLNSL